MNTVVRCARGLLDRAEELAVLVNSTASTSLRELQLRLDLSEINDRKLFVIEGQTSIRLPVAW